jgi:hypothetical protein
MRNFTISLGRGARCSSRQVSKLRFGVVFSSTSEVNVQKHRSQILHPVAALFTAQPAAVNLVIVVGAARIVVHSD